MDGAVELVTTIEACFGEVEAPLVGASCEHSHLDILAITNPRCDLRGSRLDRPGAVRPASRGGLKTFLKLPGSIPSPDTFSGY